MKINRYKISTPTEVITLPLNIPENYRQQCIDEVYKLGDQMNKSTNVQANMSWWNIWEKTSQFNQILDNIIVAAEKLVPHDTRYTYKIVDAWTACYQNDHYTKPHDHVPYTLSFVYYLQANPNSSPIIFSDSNSQINPESDMLIIFPSYVRHEVPCQKDTEDRIVLAGNIFQTTLDPKPNIPSPKDHYINA